MTNIENTQNKATLLRGFLTGKYKFRYDTIRNLIEIANKNTDNWEKLHEQQLWLEVNERHKETGMDYLINTISSPAISKPHNPITSYLSRITPLENAVENLADYIVFEDNSQKERTRFISLFKKWYVGMFKTLLQPNYVHKQALIFQGGQGIGKTPFCCNILPIALKGFIKYAPSLDLNNKDSRIALSRYILIVIDEIDDFFKDKANRTNYKAFVTQEIISERLPYARSATELPRISSFLGTCNESNFLNDPSGTQRFTVFKIKAFKNKKYGAVNLIENFDFEGLAAYAYNLALQGFEPEYSIAEEISNEHQNEEFKHNTPEFEVIINHLEPVSKSDDDSLFMTASGICSFLNKQQNEIVFNNISLGRALIRLKYQKTQNRINKTPIYGYSVRKI